MSNWPGYRRPRPRPRRCSCRRRIAVALVAVDALLVRRRPRRLDLLLLFFLSFFDSFVFFVRMRGLASSSRFFFVANSSLHLSSGFWFSPAALDRAPSSSSATAPIYSSLLPRLMTQVYYNNASSSDLYQQLL